jgi:hypothetical protein
MLDLYKLERLHQQIVEHDNILLDTITAQRMLEDAEWITDPFEGIGLTLAIATNDYAAMPVFINRHPTVRVTMHYVPGRMVKMRLAPFTVHLYTDDVTNNTYAVASTYGRALVLAMLQLEIIYERKRQINDAA